MYVANCVQAIHNATKPSQWRYNDSANNPADLAKCEVPPKQIDGVEVDVWA